MSERRQVAEALEWAYPLRAEADGVPVSKHGRILMLKNFANIPLEGTAQRYVLNDSDIRGHHRKWDEEGYLRSQ